MEDFGEDQLDGIHVPKCTKMKENKKTDVIVICNDYCMLIMVK